MNEFLAVDVATPELKALYLSCFDEDEKAADIIFSQILSKAKAYLARVDGETAAAVYLLPCSLSNGGDTVQAHYLMGAGTREISGQRVDERVDKICAQGCCKPWRFIFRARACKSHAL